MPPTATIYIQDACYKHQYIRSKNDSHIVERPERLRAVKVGLAAAMARLETLTVLPQHQSAPAKPENITDALADALSRVKLSPEPSAFNMISVVHSSASVDILNNPAVKFIHGDVNGDVYPQNLKSWVEKSWDKIANGGSEIPEGLPQNDLYLCPESLNAIQGALGTVCEAVDGVMDLPKSEAEGNPVPSRRAFVVVRPPGHHCGEDTPCGFCFANNVAVAAAHAHLNHGINRVVIFDIDLHHGNGTQSIVWQINEESYRRTLESEGGSPTTKPGLRVYYGSVHDILSFPCEDGKTEYIQAASSNIHGAHGQYIQNVHLEPYTSETHFFEELYAKRYSTLLQKAEDFLDETGGPGDDILIFISCGMDACEHEYESMSRHNRKVPTSFYHRFTRDAYALSEKYAKGRIISVLEGGYSDRALVSGAMAHLCGLVDHPAVEESWWKVENLIKIEAATKKRRGGKPSLSGPGSVDVEPWVQRTTEIFASLDANAPTSRLAIPVLPPSSSMTLRERKKPSPAPSPSSKRPGKVKAIAKEKSSLAPTTSTAEDESSLSELDEAKGKSDTEPKKLPKVILKLGPRPDE